MTGWQTAICLIALAGVCMAIWDGLKQTVQDALDEWRENHA